ncbi:MAG: hypothetical protein KAX05_01670 [Bacteroidales bacterium]|nr:hypothetical protein [Bacteroidales bacterium]
MFTNAIVRTPGKNFNQGITTAKLEKPDYFTTLRQHDAYCKVIENCGLNITILPPDPDYPDCPFVEDTAVITKDFVIITRPGDKKRQGEEEKIEEVLRPFRKIEKIKSPGTVDGGDILQAENHFFIGLSGRTNTEGAKQLGTIFSRYGYTFSTISVINLLHLKSGVSYLGKNILILHKDLCSSKEFKSFIKIPVLKKERYAANSLMINNSLLLPEGFPDTRKKLKELGFPVYELEMSEFQKMDGGLSCLSLRF